MFKPMLAGKIENLNQIQFPVYASPKLDGIRAVVMDNQLLSRKLKLIPNRHVQKMFKDLEGLDGELICGDPTALDVFRKTSSAVMSHEGSPDVVFYVFDAIRHPELPFDQRWIKIYKTIAKFPHVKLVPQIMISDLDELLEYEAKCLGEGYEGVMLRSIDGRYKHGRSTVREGILLKLKRFMDDEAVVIGFEEQMKNTNEAEINELGKTKRSHKKAGMVAKGTLGALVVRSKSGVEFNIGTGLDDATRQDIWENRTYYLNQWVKYSYFPTGSKDKPRFPKFLGFRDEIDM